jgi:hypothetical protein
MKTILAGVLLSLAAPVASAAQSATPVGISPGSRLRVSIAGGPLVVASVVSMTPETLELADTGARIAISTASLTSLEVSRGRPIYGSRLAKGALKGFLIVGGAGTALLVVTGAGFEGLGPLWFGPPGAAIGALTSYARRPEVWERIPLSVSMGPQLAGFPTESIRVRAETPGKPSRGRRILIGVLVGTAVGIGYAASEQEEGEDFDSLRLITIVIPAGLVGGAIGAFIR